MKYIYRILLVLAQVPVLFRIRCQDAKTLEMLNWLPDVSEKQVQIASFIEILEPLSMEESKRKFNDQII